MTGVECASYGLFGAFALDALAFHWAMIRVGDLPWRGEDEPPSIACPIGSMINIFVGGGLAGWSRQVSGPFGALAIGVAAPKTFEELAGRIPLRTHPAETASVPRPDSQVQPGAEPAGGDAS